MRKKKFFLIAVCLTAAMGAISSCKTSDHGLGNQ